MNQDEYICERCNAEEAFYHCHSCQPFHYFCTNCDTCIHSFPNKHNHERIPLFHQPKQEVTYEYDNNSRSRSKPRSASKTKLNRSTKVSGESNMLTPISINSSSEYGKMYTKEYVIELKQIYEKEKGELQYKLTAMQNNLDRLKFTFQDQMQKMQDEANLNLTKNKLKEDDQINKLHSIIQEKQSVIKQLSKENEVLKSQVVSLNGKLTLQSEQSKENSMCYNQQIEKLKEEIANLNSSHTQIHHDNIDNLQSMTARFNDDIMNIQENHKKDISDIIHEHQYKENQMKHDLETHIHDLKIINRKNDELMGVIDKMTKKNDILRSENKSINDTCSKLHDKIRMMDERNRELLRAFEKEKSDNVQIKDDLDFFEKTIDNLKKEIDLLKDANEKAEDDYNTLMCQSEQMRKDFSEKIFNTDKLEQKITNLLAENQVLNSKMKKKYSGAQTPKEKETIPMTYEMI